ncbi:hypothetical protein [Polynucleobacter sp. JS-Safj-400b-B2]|jgi:hypothetical protein|nr:hypothetical protein [Polynucleobacter sp. JS-Safj-400b-B2]
MSYGLTIKVSPLVKQGQLNTAITVATLMLMEDIADLGLHT